jgi:hypothetical protein
MFLLGFFTGAVVTLLGAYVFIRMFHKLENKFAPRWYPVISYSADIDEDGVYSMVILITDGYTCHGYTKKLPPQGIFPQNLEAKIRKIHPKRGYRLFWRIKG